MQTPKVRLSLWYYMSSIRQITTREINPSSTFFRNRRDNISLKYLSIVKNGRIHAWLVPVDVLIEIQVKLDMNRLKNITLI